MTQPDPHDVLNLSESLLKATDDFGQCMGILDSKSKRLTHTNNSFCRLLGYTSAELMALPSFLSLLPPQHHQWFSDVSSTGPGLQMSASIEMSMLQKTGSRVFVELAYGRLETDKTHAHIVVLFKDITRKKQVEDQLQLFQTLTLAVNEARDFPTALGMVLRKVCLATGWEYGEAWVPSLDDTRLELSPITYGADSDIERLRKSRQTVTFRRGEGLPGRAWAEKYPQWVEDIEQDNDAISKLVKWEFGLQIGMAIPLVAREGVVAVLVFLVSKRDCTRDFFRGVASVVAPQLGSFFQRRKAEEELKRSNIFLDSIVENIPDMVFIKEASDLRFVRFNRAGEELLGISRDKMIGKTDYDFFPKEEADFFTKKDKIVLENGELVEITEEPIHTKKGLRLLHTKKIPILDENKNPVYLLGISEDITDKKR